jgi:hypothetical protein
MLFLGNTGFQTPAELARDYIVTFNTNEDSFRQPISIFPLQRKIAQNGLLRLNFMKTQKLLLASFCA